MSRTSLLSPPPFLFVMLGSPSQPRLLSPCWGGSGVTSRMAQCDNGMGSCSPGLALVRAPSAWASPSPQAPPSLSPLGSLLGGPVTAVTLSAPCSPWGSFPLNTTWLCSPRRTCADPRLHLQSRARAWHGAGVQLHLEEGGRSGGEQREAETWACVRGGLVVTPGQAAHLETQWPSFLTAEKAAAVRSPRSGLAGSGQQGGGWEEACAPREVSHTVPDAPGSRLGQLIKRL